ncbi:hypothetical protein CCASP_03715 [Corynebacterium caspium DSM 44850]|nr:hypothetical protein CCASP_03715 [Corynebacterium caspium DSM 44850]
MGMVFNYAIDIYSSVFLETYAEQLKFSLNVLATLPLTFLITLPTVFAPVLVRFSMARRGVLHNPQEHLAELKNG